MKTFRVVTGTSIETGHFFKEGDIVTPTGLEEGSRKEFRCVEGSIVGLEQMLRPEDVEAIE